MNSKRPGSGRRRQPVGLSGRAVTGLSTCHGAVVLNADQQGSALAVGQTHNRLNDGRVGDRPPLELKREGFAVVQCGAKVEGHDPKLMP